MPGEGAAGWKRAIVLLALVGAVLATSGCGGGGGSEPLSKEDYVEEMQAIGNDLSSALAALGTTTTAADAAAALTTIQEELESAAASMDALAAPEEIETEHAELVSAVEEFGEQLGPVITKLEETDEIGVVGEVQGLSAFTDLQEASNAIVAKGYDIGAG
jgi:hypothetical protein